MSRPDSPSIPELQTTPDFFDAIIEIGLIVLIALPSLVMGAVAPWAWSTVFVISLVLFTLWMIQAGWKGQLRIRGLWLWGLAVAFLGIGAIQLIPWSPAMLRLLSHGSAQTYETVCPGAALQSNLISLFPHGTRMQLLRLASLALIMFVTVHAIRTPKQATRIALVLVAVALFQVLYGLGEHFSGRNQIFWHIRNAHLSAVTGTFRNKNHLAGLLEMALPVALGLSFAFLPRIPRHRMMRSHTIDALSSPKTYLPLALALAAVIIGTGICFTLSRAGIISMCVSLVVFVLLLGLSMRFRTYTLLLLLVVAAVLLVAIAIGAEIVVDRMEEAFSARASSWMNRVELTKCGLRMFREFPAFGSGLGSFRHVFERFQSTRYGNSIVDYLHNDWVQLLCEAGLMGGLIVLAGVTAFVWSTIRLALSRKSPYCRLVSLSALLGMVAMLIHSFFDYNLSKITSNGIIFFVLAGLAYSVSRMQSPDSPETVRQAWVTINLKSLPLRVSVIVVAIAVSAIVMAWPIRVARANIARNRFVAAAELDCEDNYFFISAERDVPPNSPQKFLRYTDQLSLSNPERYYLAGLYLTRMAERTVLTSAEAVARTILGDTVAATDPDAVSQLAKALARNVATYATPELAQLLRASEQKIRQAIALQPAYSQHHLLLAHTLAMRKKIEPTADIADPLDHVQHAVWLAPTRPYVLFSAGKLLLAASLESGGSPDPGRLAQVRKLFRRTIFIDASYTAEIYPLVRATMGGAKALLLVTSEDLPAYQRLASTLWKESAWEELLECLDVMSRLCARPEKRGSWPLLANRRQEKVSPETVGIFADEESLSVRYGGQHDARNTEKMRLWVAQKRCMVLGLLGRWEDRARAVGVYRAWLRKSLKPGLDEARRLQAQRRYEPAAGACREILQQDWGNPEALLTAAEIAASQDRQSIAPLWESALDHLYKLIIYHEELSPKDWKQAQRILKKTKLNSAEDHLRADFIQGTGEILSGNTKPGIAILEKLAARKDKTATVWRQRHLIWHYLGFGYEHIGRNADAIQAYCQVIKIVPTHRNSLLKLSDLGVNVSAQLAALTPDVLCNINFGGKLKLIGFSLRLLSHIKAQDNPDSVMQTWEMTYFWEMQKRMYSDYRFGANFYGLDRKGILVHNHHFRMNNSSYPVDFPRNGEVLVQQYPAVFPPKTVEYLGISIWTLNSPKQVLPIMPTRIGIAESLLRIGPDI